LRAGKRGRFVLSLSACLVVAVSLFSQGPPPEPRAVPRIEGKIVVDGRLDEAAWQQALLLDLPFETEPGENIPAPVRTTVRVFHDRNESISAWTASTPLRP
jgi:hypothetical protein